MQDKPTQDPDYELTDEERHRKAWLKHALQTSPPLSRKTKEETLLSKIIAILQNSDLS